MEKRTVFTPQRYIPSREADSSWQKYLTEAKDPPGFVVKKIDDTIGKGVFTKNKIRAGSFIMEYCGELIDLKTAQEREREYPKEYGSYMLFFRHKRKLCCIDATYSTAYGRYINDGTGADKNAELKVVVVKNVPHVVLFADRNIKPNEEVRFDYGVSNLPWRVKTEKEHYSLRSRDATMETKTLRKCELKNLRVHIKRCDKAFPDGKTYLEKEDGTFIEISCKLNGDESTMSLTDPRETPCTFRNVSTNESAKDILQGQINQTNGNEEIYFASPYYGTEQDEEDTYATSKLEPKCILKRNVMIEEQDQHVCDENTIAVTPSQSFEGHIIRDNAVFLEEKTPISGIRKLSMSIKKRDDLSKKLQNNDETFTKFPTEISGNNSNYAWQTQDETSPLVNEDNNFNRSLVTKDETIPMVNEDNNSDNSFETVEETTQMFSEEFESSLLTIEDSTSDDSNNTAGVASRDISEITIIIEDQDQHVCGECCIEVTPGAMFEGHVNGDKTESTEENALISEFCNLSMSIKKNNKTLTKFPTKISGEKLNKKMQIQDETARTVSGGNISNRSLVTNVETTPIVNEGDISYRSLITLDETIPLVNGGNISDRSLVTLDETTPLDSEGNISNRSLVSLYETYPMVSEDNIADSSLVTLDETIPLASEGNNSDRSLLTMDETSPKVSEGNISDRSLVTKYETSPMVSEGNISDRSLVTLDETIPLFSEGYIANRSLVAQDESTPMVNGGNISDRSLVTLDETIPLVSEGNISDRSLVSQDETIPLVNEANMSDRSLVTQHESTPMASEGDISNRSLVTQNENIPIVSKGIISSRSLVTRDETTSMIIKGNIANRLLVTRDESKAMVNGGQISDRSLVTLDETVPLAKEGNISDRLQVNLGETNPLVSEGNISDRLLVTLDETVPSVSEGNISDRSQVTLGETNPLVSEGNIYNRSLVTQNENISMVNGGNISDRSPVTLDETIPLVSEGNISNRSLVTLYETSPMVSEGIISDSSLVILDETIPLVSEGNISDRSRLTKDETSPMVSESNISDRSLVTMDVTIPLVIEGYIANRSLVAQDESTPMVNGGNISDRSLVTLDETIPLVSEGNISNRSLVTQDETIPLVSESNISDRSLVTQNESTPMANEGEISNRSLVTQNGNIPIVSKGNISSKSLVTRNEPSSMIIKGNIANRLLVTRDESKAMVNGGQISDRSLVTLDETVPLASEGNISDRSQVSLGETNPLVSEGNISDRSLVTLDETVPSVSEGNISDRSQVTLGETNQLVSEGNISDRSLVTLDETVPLVSEGNISDSSQVTLGETNPLVSEDNVSDRSVVTLDETVPLDSEGNISDRSVVTKDETTPMVIEGNIPNGSLVTLDEATPKVNEGNNSNRLLVIQDDTTRIVSEDNNFNNSLETLDETIPMVNEDSSFNSLSVTQDKTTHMVNEEVESSLLRIKDCTSRNKTTGANNNNSNQVGPLEIKHHPKPHRPCPYCMCNKSALTRHLKAKHSDEEEVKTAMSLPKKKQNRAFLLLKRKGIMVKNIEMLRKSSKNRRELLVERKSRGKKASKSKDTIYCSKCFGFFKKDYFHRHRRTCHLKEDIPYVPFAITPQNASKQSNKDDEFNAEILSSLHNDVIGKICKKDSIIQNYGRKNFKKLQNRKQIKNYEDRKNVIRMEMRRLGQLFHEFGNVCDTNNIQYKSSVDMLKRDNFNNLQTAIENMTTDGGVEMKPAVRKGIGYLLKRFAKYLHGYFSVEKKDDVVSELNKFLDVLNHFWQDIFGKAEYTLAYKRQTMLIDPQNLPDEKDIKKLRDIMLSKLGEFTENDFIFISSDEFRLLRDIVVSRLTLFNARRGDELSRLTIHQWKEADQDNWIGEKSHTQDPMERFLLGKFKITYHVEKGGRLVSLLILNDCWKALEKLCDNEIRKQAGIHSDNTYVFPLTQYSKNHVSGWVSVRECCSMAKLENMITATSMRHYIATVYAGLEMSDSDRETFYSNIGHSASVNKHIYQSPLARQTITNSGKFLEGVDKGMHRIATCSEAVTPTDIEGKQKVNKEKSHNDSAQEKGNYTVTMERSDPFEKKDNDSDYHPSIDHPSSDDSDENCYECIEEPISPRKKRKYVPWEKEDTRMIQNYFQKYIYSSDVVTGNCGPLPNVNELKVFLVKHPSMIKELPMRDQIARLRTKIFNERKLYREKLSKFTGRGKRCTDV